MVIETAGIWHHQAIELVKEIRKRTTNITGYKRDLLLVPTDVHSTAEGERGLISKHVHYQLVRGNHYNFLLLYSVNSKSPGI